MKIIFDIGCNEGQNFEYYLKKADVVIGIDGDESLINRNKKKFKSYINKKKLFLENIALSNSKSYSNFYIHKYKNVLSQLKKPKNIHDYKVVKIKNTTCSTLIKKYLKKFNIKKIKLIKIDVENSSEEVLNDLIKNKIFSNYLSVEAHDSQILYLLLKSPYKSFKILNGNDIGTKIKNLKIKTKNISTYNLFQKHSAGPYGDDIPGKYYNKLSLLNFFINNGFGWIDISCSIKSSKNYKIVEYKKEIHNPRFREKLKQLINDVIIILKKKFKLF